MISRIKKFIPLSARRSIKWLGYAALDIIRPLGAPRVPPRRKTFIGGGDFVMVGDNFLDHLKRHGLMPNMDILDVGCGQGRMARPLVDYLDPDKGGHYAGFDIVKTGIRWCQTHYQGLEHFKFIHANIYNQRYNKAGNIKAEDYKFPFDAKTFDIAFATSVFTHMYAADVAHYLGEIAHTLRPGGQCLTTWFLWPQNPKQYPTPKLDFCHPIDAVSKTTTPQYPEAAIAFDEAFVQNLYRQAGLNIVAIERGHWLDPNSPFQFQDMIIARKPG